ncbi:hypothetical protein CMI37_37795 [Candidatus Pacearchaeota archaeon]|nr:hypothetical protein [Candidatus Pacearchaeota archaeon]
MAHLKLPANPLTPQRPPDKVPTVVILRGLPGSGKSTVEQLLVAHTILSMDAFWELGGGGYKFRPSDIAEAIQWVRDDFIRALAARDELIVVDNTNTTMEEMAFYRREAKAAGYVVHIVHVEATVEDAASRGIHGVPKKKVEQMRARWEPV